MSGNPIIPLETFLKEVRTITRYWTGDFGLIYYTIARTLRCKVMLDSGVGHGYSTALIARAAQETGAAMIAVDGLQDHIPLHRIMDNLTRCGVASFVRFYIGDAIEQFERLSGEGLLDGLGFAAIDDFHSYAQVHREIEILWPHLMEGGVLAFHDTCTKYTDAKGQDLEGVRRAVLEWQRRTGAGSLWIPGNNGLTLLQKPYTALPILPFGDEAT